jgi:hypothetical protein
MTGHNPDGKRARAFLYLVTAVVMIMALAMPWASAEDVATAGAEETESTTDQTEPSPTPSEEPEPEETEPAPEETEPAPEETEVPEPEETETEEPVDTEATEEAEEKAVAPTDAEKTQPAAPPGNNGTVKVDGVDFDSHPDNEPKPGCSFQIDYTGFDDPTQAFSHTFTIQSGDGNGTVVGGTSGNLVGGAGSFNHDLSSALSAFDPKEDGYYHIKLDVSLPGVPGGSKHKVFKVACGDPPEEEGFIIVEKQVTTAGAPDENFGFSGDLGNFSLGDGDSIGPVSVEPGSYDITETISNAQSLAGWSFGTVSCGDVTSDRAGGDISVAAASDHSAENVEVEDGETILCIFYNGWVEPEEQGGVIIAKDVLTAGAPSEDFAFEGDFGNFTLSDGEDTGLMTVAPGDFNVSEVLTDEQEAAGWAFDDVVCETLQVNVPARRGFFPASTHTKDFSVGADEIVECTFTNVYQPDLPEGQGRVIVEKNVVGDIPVGPQNFSFDGTLGDFNLGDGQSESFDVEPGEYSVGEDLSGLGEGWSLKSAVCVEEDSPRVGNVVSSVEEALASIDVADGETVTCTYTNEYTEVLGETERKPRPKVLSDLVVKERQATVIGTTIRRAPLLPFTGNDDLAPLLLTALLLVAGGTLIVRTARKQQ